MTLEEKVIEHLVTCGMSNAQAGEVIELMKAEKEDYWITSYVLPRLGDDVSGYPPKFPNTLCLYSRRYALAWVDKNLPEAWFRPMFQ